MQSPALIILLPETPPEPNPNPLSHSWEIGLFKAQLQD